MKASMAKSFKKGQRVIATLPTGRVVEGIYIEAYGSEGHSFYINEFDGVGRDGHPKYKKVRYGVTDEYIEAADAGNKSKPTENQYRAWLKRAIDLECRIKEIEKNIEIDKNNDTALAKHNQKLNRTKEKLTAINEKIKKYEE